jgi:SH3-like domain-containing protein
LICKTRAAGRLSGWALILLLALPGGQAAAQAMCARRTVNLHKGAGYGTPVTWKVAKYMPFLRLERKGSWSKVQDLEGQVHWLPSRELTAGIRCVVIKTNVAKLHKDPQMSAPAAVLRTLDRYTPLKRIKDQSEWIQVEDEDGHRAWVHESQVWKPVLVQSFSF